MKTLRVLLSAFLLAAVLAAMPPQRVLAQDGCGLLGFVFGCRYDQRGMEIQNEHTEDMAQINAQATATALAAQQAVKQLEYQRWLDSQQVQAELEQVASRERVNMAKIQYELEQMYSDERTSQLAATTAFNVAALWQYRRAAEVQAQPRLLPADDWQRRAVGLLEQKRVPWLLRDQRLLAQIDGEWVMVEKD